MLYVRLVKTSDGKERLYPADVEILNTVPDERSSTGYTTYVAWEYYLPNGKRRVRHGVDQLPYMIMILMNCAERRLSRPDEPAPGVSWPRERYTPPVELAA